MATERHTTSQELLRLLEAGGGLTRLELSRQPKSNQEPRRHCLPKVIGGYGRFPSQSGVWPRPEGFRPNFDRSPLTGYPANKLAQVSVKQQ